MKKKNNEIVNITGLSLEEWVRIKHPDIYLQYQKYTNENLYITE